MFVRLRPDFSAVAAKTHVSDSAVPWRGASPSYDQVRAVNFGRFPFTIRADMPALCNPNPQLKVNHSSKLCPPCLTTPEEQPMSKCSVAPLHSCHSWSAKCKSGHVHLVVMQV